MCKICQCKTPGLQMDGDVNLEEVSNHGQPCWIATQPIGYMFGQEVDGECQGIGKTKEEALERLEEDKKKLYESMWV